MFFSRVLFLSDGCSPAVGQPDTTGPGCLRDILISSSFESDKFTNRKYKGRVVKGGTVEQQRELVLSLFCVHLLNPKLEDITGSSGRRSARLSGRAGQGWAEQDAGVSGVPEANNQSSPQEYSGQLSSTSLCKHEQRKPLSNRWKIKTCRFPAVYPRFTNWAKKTLRSLPCNNAPTPVRKCEPF